MKILVSTIIVGLLLSLLGILAWPILERVRVSPAGYAIGQQKEIVLITNSNTFLPEEEIPEVYSFRLREGEVVVLPVVPVMKMVEIGSTGREEFSKMLNQMHVHYLGEVQTTYDLKNNIALLSLDTERDMILDDLCDHDIHAYASYLEAQRMLDDADLHVMMKGHSQLNLVYEAERSYERKHQVLIRTQIRNIRILNTWKQAIFQRLARADYLSQIL